MILINKTILNNENSYIPPLRIINILKDTQFVCVDNYSIHKGVHSIASLKKYYENQATNSKFSVF